MNTPSRPPAKPPKIPHTPKKFPPSNKLPKKEPIAPKIDAPIYTTFLSITLKLTILISAQILTQDSRFVGAQHLFEFIVASLLNTTQTTKSF